MEAQDRQRHHVGASSASAQQLQLDSSLHQQQQHALVGPPQLPYPAYTQQAYRMLPHFCDASHQSVDSISLDASSSAPPPPIFAIHPYHGQPPPQFLNMPGQQAYQHLQGPIYVAGSHPSAVGPMSSGMPMGSSTTVVGMVKKNKKPDFLLKLYRMLQVEDPKIISWDNGYIHVNDPRALAQEILHKYFRHSKYSSFQRQLNYFGFRKSDGKGKLAACTYTNDDLRADGSLKCLLKIKRKTNPGTQKPAEDHRYDKDSGSEDEGPRGQTLTPRTQEKDRLLFLYQMASADDSMGLEDGSSLQSPPPPAQSDCGPHCHYQHDEHHRQSMPSQYAQTHRPHDYSHPSTDVKEEQPESSYYSHQRQQQHHQSFPQPQPQPPLSSESTSCTSYSYPAAYAEPSRGPYRRTQFSHLTPSYLHHPPPPLTLKDEDPREAPDLQSPDPILSPTPSLISPTGTSLPNFHESVLDTPHGQGPAGVRLDSPTTMLRDAGWDHRTSGSNISPCRPPLQLKV